MGEPKTASIAAALELLETPGDLDAITLAARIVERIARDPAAARDELSRDHPGATALGLWMMFVGRVHRAQAAMFARGASGAALAARLTRAGTVLAAVPMKPLRESLPRDGR